jgi:hypothetical protein
VPRISDERSNLRMDGPPRSVPIHQPAKPSICNLRHSSKSR